MTNRAEWTMPRTGEHDDAAFVSRKSREWTSAFCATFHWIRGSRAKKTPCSYTPVHKSLRATLPLPTLPSLLIRHFAYSFNNHACSLVSAADVLPSCNRLMMLPDNHLSRTARSPGSHFASFGSPSHLSHGSFPSSATQVSGEMPLSICRLCYSCATLCAKTDEKLRQRCA
jgi:hypothetical protein